MPSRYSSIEDYLAAQDAVKARTLRAILDFILTTFPELEAKISWNVPTVHRHGKYVAGLAAYKKHLTFAPWSAEIIGAFQERLKGYVTFKNCFQIPVDWQVDEELIGDLVRARLTDLVREE